MLHSAASLSASSLNNKKKAQRGLMLYLASGLLGKISTVSISGQAKTILMTTTFKDGK
jgi:hypothetical protein